MVDSGRGGSAAVGRGLQWLALVAGFLVAAAVASAQEARSGTAQQWQTELRAVGESLIAGEWVSAERSADVLASEMSAQIVGGTGADLLLGVATTYRAIAVAGQGRAEEAVWHWQVAQQLFPQVAELDLARFGPAAALLADHPPRGRGAARDGQSPERRGTFVPPHRLSAPAPRFPAGRAFRGVAVDVVVQVIVGVDGRPGQPLILESEGELTLVLSALEALREWTFEPGRRDGVPEASLYTLTVSFVVPEG